MAGIAKPNVANLQREVACTIIESHTDGATNASGLFDGTQPNAFIYSTVAYFVDYNDYIVLQIHEPCHIWRSGVDNWTGHNAPFTIQRLENGYWVDVTNSYPQTLTRIGNTKWEKTISGLPEGTYRFIGTSNRLDSEWYLEMDQNSILGSTGLLVSHKNLLDILKPLFKRIASEYAHEKYTDAEISTAIDEVWR